MGKIRRGGYIFVKWRSDHGNHVHVFRNRREVVKWDLDAGLEIEGKASARIKTILAELQEEGRI